MTMRVQRMVAAAASCLWAAAAVAGERTAPGVVYERLGPRSSGTATLALDPRPPASVAVSLHVVSGHATPRTGTLDSVELPVVAGVALYREADEPGSPGCAIAFVLPTPSAPSVQVAQFGNCRPFGVGVVATGAYRKRR